mgnify:CR=1 FL=1
MIDHLQDEVVSISNFTDLDLDIVHIQLSDIGFCLLVWIPISIVYFLQFLHNCYDIAYNFVC